MIDITASVFFIFSPKHDHRTDSHLASKFHPRPSKNSIANVTLKKNIFPTELLLLYALGAFED